MCSGNSSTKEMNILYQRDSALLYSIFTAAVFIRAQVWNQAMCSSSEDWTKEMWWGLYCGVLGKDAASIVGIS